MECILVQLKNTFILAVSEPVTSVFWLTGGVSEKQRSLFGLIDRDRRGYQFAFTLVWKDGTF